MSKGPQLFCDATGYSPFSSVAAM